jgi:hypothetical protein
MLRGLRTKQLELYDNVCSADHSIICLSETWLNHLCYDHNLFPDCYTVFRSDRDCAKKTRGGGVLTVISSSVRSCKCRRDLESWDECVWIEVPTLDGLNLLIGNLYFAPDTKPEAISNYLTASMVWWLALKTTNTEVPGSIPGHSLGFF